MKKVKKLEAEGFYVLEAQNAANTHLIENNRELDQFLTFVDGHCRNYMNIHDYCITPTGWHLLVKIKDAETILRNYEKAQERRNKPAVLDEVWLIISNIIRLLRSRMTMWTNKKRGREGNASKKTYRRYIFDSLDEGKSHIENVRAQSINLEQPNVRYQANPAHYDEKQEIKVCSDKLSSKTSQENKKKKVIYLKCLQVGDYLTVKLERWIRKTCDMHGVGYEEVGLRV